MIIRPLQTIRLGASIQIPTFYYLDDEKYTDANSSWDRSSGIPDGNGVSPYGYYDYRLRSPMKVNAHASAILFRMATISAAYEYMDYSDAQLDSYNDRFLTENENIRNNLQGVHHLKAGAEVRIDLVYLRSGLQYLRSPYSDPRNDASEWIWSGGFGVRTKAAFFDISYSRGSRTEVYGLYSPDNSAPESSYTSINQVNPNNLLLTMGLRF
jgi:hypothetical protein